MPSLTGNVGAGGLNRKHDVSLIQAMLRVIKNPKGQPYASFSYDGTCSPTGATVAAIKALQNDHKINSGPPLESAGKIEINGKTFKKMVELLPASHKEIAALEDHKVVYLKGSQAEANAAAARVTSDPKFLDDFKIKLAMLINNFYKKYGIVLSVMEDKYNGGFRTFQQQRDLMDRVENGQSVTNAGPGESNHNWGNGADVGFQGLKVLKGDGSIVKHTGTPTGDSPWLHQLEAIDSTAATKLWNLRNAETTLHRSAKAGDMGHLQSFSDAQISMGTSLAKHMNKEGSMWWEYKQGAYWCNYGLADENTKFKLGSAKKIWDNRADSKVNVDEASLALAMNQAAARKNSGGLPPYEEEIYQAIIKLTPDPPSVWRKEHIKSAHCNKMRDFFKADLETSEANYTTWKPYDKNGNPI
ncbi:MAG: hypothetical protein AB7Q37_00190 [Pyrinomonadaceae bacterium]